MAPETLINFDVADETPKPPAVLLASETSASQLFVYCRVPV